MQRMTAVQDMHINLHLMYVLYVYSRVMRAGSGWGCMKEDFDTQVGPSLYIVMK